MFKRLLLIVSLVTSSLSAHFSVQRNATTPVVAADQDFYQATKSETVTLVYAKDAMAAISQKCNDPAIFRDMVMALLRAIYTITDKTGTSVVAPLLQQQEGTVNLIFNGVTHTVKPVNAEGALIIQWLDTLFDGANFDLLCTARVHLNPEDAIVWKRGEYILRRVQDVSTQKVH